MCDVRALCPDCSGRPHDGPCQQRPLPRRCSRWTGPGYCGAVEGTRQYACGYRCPAHTPAALVGQPEPPTATPGVPEYRRDHLAAVICSMPELITAAALAAESRTAGWDGNPLTARRDIRALVARGLLIPVSTADTTVYRPATKDRSCDSSTAAA